MAPFTAPKVTVQQLLQRYSSTSANVHVQRVLHRLKICRTSSLGYHVYGCSDEQCGGLKYQYHSCRDRHCPQCGALKKQEWIEARRQELLPVKYYHVVFTLPHELNSLVMGHRALLYKLLFDASAQTLLRFAADQKYLGATPGIISVLHTWGQQLSFHPHVHCIISGGGIGADNSWKNGIKNDWQFLFPVKAMRIVYRAKFLQALQQLINKGEVSAQPAVDVKLLIDQLYLKNWMVYAKAPFGGPHAVVEYLGRYTHKVAISNHRLCAINEVDNTVTFGYKDYADNSKQKQMTLGCPEFIRRFEQHILPKRFTKIRTYGYLANSNRQQRINAVLKKMQLPLHKGLVKIPLELRMKEQYGLTLTKCPVCGKNSMELLHIFYPFGNGVVKNRADDG